ncbi:hypothetical protein ACROYT_G034104 [Oculina patagonica]
MQSTISNNSSSIPTDQGVSNNVIAQLLPIAILIVFVNGIVFLLFAKEKRLRTPTNYLLFSLAVCDFMTGFINVPLTIIMLMRLISPPPGKILGFFLVVLHNLVVVLVVYHIFAITAERYFSIIHPFRHRWQMTKKSSLKIIGIIWLAAVIIAFMPITWFTRFLTSPQSGILTVTLQIQMGHIIFCIVFVFLAPYVFIVYSQFVMFKKIKQNTLTFRGERGADSSVYRKAKDSKRCLIIFALMAFFYAICWFPWFVISLFHSLWFPLGKEAYKILLEFSQAFLILRYLTSIVNPVLYTFLKRDFLDAFKTIILRRKIQRRNSQPASLIQDPVTLERGFDNHCLRLLVKEEAASFPGSVSPGNEVEDEEYMEYITVV